MVEDRSDEGVFALGAYQAIRLSRLPARALPERLDLEALVTARRPLGEINPAMDDLRAGRGVRTILTIA